MAQFPAVTERRQSNHCGQPGHLGSMLPTRYESPATTLRHSPGSTDPPESESAKLGGMYLVSGLFSSSVVRTGSYAGQHMTLQHPPPCLSGTQLIAQESSTLPASDHPYSASLGSMGVHVISSSFSICDLNNVFSAL